MKKSFLVLVVLVVATPLRAGVIALIIDDIGYGFDRGMRAAKLDPAVTLSLLPDAPDSQTLAVALRHMGREIMLHMPMQSVQREGPFEPVVLRNDMSRDEFQRSVIEALVKFPGVAGLNNHMGSLLTRDQRYMGWLMEVLRAYNHIYFVDSRTDRQTVAEQVARHYRLATTRRDVFLDNGDPAAPGPVWAELRRLERLASSRGFALGIGHPHPVTLAVLEKGIPWLRAKGHTIVPVSEYIAAKESQSCPECSSPSLKLVKNSKRSPSSTCCAGPVLR